MWRTTLLLAALAVSLAACGCRRSRASKDYSRSHNFRPSDALERPRRVVSLAPNLTEIVFAIGAGDRLVGVTRYCDRPAQAKTIRSVGGFVDPHLETIVGLKPDLVLATKNSGALAAVKRLETLGLRVYWARVQTLDEILRSCLHVGVLLGVSEKAQKLVARLRKQSDAIRARRRSRPSRRVLMIVGHNPLIAAGPGSYGGHLLSLLHLANAAGKSRVAYPTIGPEALVALDPDVIVDA
ncbi:MAG: ABC transporter substrate-binding protein, partial [Myxococcales bacterium]|nr:ABC transporter substrate-binding protein [Myxococcales bacterium]